MFAKQTRSGRACLSGFKVLAIWLDQGDSQNTFVNQAISEFMTAVTCSVTLVFDRGFAAPTMSSIYVGNIILFVLRIKGVQEGAGRKGGTKARWLPAGLNPVWAYGHR